LRIFVKPLKNKLLFYREASGFYGEFQPEWCEGTVDEIFRPNWLLRTQWWDYSLKCARATLSRTNTDLLRASANIYVMTFDYYLNIF